MKRMSTLLILLLILGVPAMTLAGEVFGPVKPGPSPKSWNNPDIFHARAHTCTTGGAPCGPENVVGGTFATYIQFWAPSTQVYTRYYIITDVEGALISLQDFSTTRNVGFNEIFTDFTLPEGVYKFISIIIGADGKFAFSDYYRFRVCIAGFCSNGP